LFVASVDVANLNAEVGDAPLAEYFPRLVPPTPWRCDMWPATSASGLAKDFIERNLVLPPVVELGRPRALVVGDVLRGFKRAIVLQVRGDAGRPEAAKAVRITWSRSFSADRCCETSLKA
jgi:hypothetical protein